MCIDLCLYSPTSNLTSDCPHFHVFSPPSVLTSMCTHYCLYSPTCVLTSICTHLHMFSHGHLMFQIWNHKTAGTCDHSDYRFYPSSDSFCVFGVFVSVRWSKVTPPHFWIGWILVIFMTSQVNGPSSWAHPIGRCWYSLVREDEEMWARTFQEYKERECNVWNLLIID